MSGNKYHTMDDDVFIHKYLCSLVGKTTTFLEEEELVLKYYSHLPCFHVQCVCVYVQHCSVVVVFAAPLSAQACGGDQQAGGSAAATTTGGCVSGGGR